MGSSSSWWNQLLLYIMHTNIYCLYQTSKALTTILLMCHTACLNMSFMHHLIKIKELKHFHYGPESSPSLSQ